MRRALVGVALLVLVQLHAPSASSATVTAVGWWTRSPAASAPEGGLTVANAPDGPVSVAALRIDVGSAGVSRGTLTLPQSGGTAPGGAQLVACVVGDGWTAEPAGALGDAPATVCTGTAAALTVDDASWTADVSDLIGDARGSVSLGIVPAAGTAGLWDLQFDAPVFQGTAAAGSSPPPTTAARAPQTTPTTAFAPRPAQTFRPAPPPAFAATTTTVAITPTTVDNFVANVAPDQAAFGGASRSSPDEGGADRPIGQAVTLVLIAAVIGVLAGVGRKVAATRAAI